MTNTFVKKLESATNYTITENGAVARKTTDSDVLDMFALGGAMRNRPDEDIQLMVQKAYDESPDLAMKCLFYLRDRESGAGERRFFRIGLNWLAQKYPKSVERNLENIPAFGRWDDLYCLVGTSIENKAFFFMKKQLALDMQSKTPSLLAKWLKSENTSSKESCALGKKTREAFNMTPKQYRKTLSILRNRINIVETLMSQNRWDEIEFDKIPSRAGFIYRNAFARHDLIKEKYEKFIKDENTKVNAGVLYPYEVVNKACELFSLSKYGVAKSCIDEVERVVINKYWDNLKDYFAGKTFNGIAVVDTSASMRGRPLDVAISLGMYCAEKNKGPWENCYISFSRYPKLVKVEGVDFVDKVRRIYDSNICENTNIEATFDLLLDIAVNNKLSQDEIPENLIIISDMEFDAAICGNSFTETLFDTIQKKWERFGYTIPKVIFWNVDARQNNIPNIGAQYSYISGFSPAIFDAVMSNKTGYDLMLEKLMSKRYENVVA